MVYVVKNPESQTDKAELAVSLAVLVLADAGKDISQENIDAVVAAAGISGLPSVFSAAFSRACDKQDLSKLLAGPKPGAGAAPAAAASSGAAAAAAPAEDEKPAKQESEADVGAGGLFGDDGGADY